MTSIDDAFANPVIIVDGESGQTIAAVAVQMFPPAPLARKVFKAMQPRLGMEPVTAPTFSWRPLREQPRTQVALAHNGRLTITGGGEVIFDDSVDALAPDAVDQAWAATARETGRVLVLIGGPRPLATPADRDQAARDRVLIGGWASFSQTIPGSAGA